MKHRRLWIIFMLLTLMVCLDIVLIDHCLKNAGLNQLLAEDTLDTLRAQEVTPERLQLFREWETENKDDYSCYEYLCAWLITGQEKQEVLDWYIQNLQEQSFSEFKVMTDYLKAVWEDLQWFPIPASTLNEEAEVSFINSWMTPRTFGGQRGHEGTDLMAAINERGRYPVVSMTDGIIEQVGWLTQGGYRLGIRSPHGGYFYYAHLYDYAREFQLGDKILAGELIGFMGDSGYSEIEGTVGNFDVHLHLGIYVNQPDGTELSINSFWPLKYLEQNKLEYPFY